MKKNVEKRTLNEYMDMNGIVLSEIDEEKKGYNKTAMTDESMSKALLELENQRLTSELEDLERDKQSLNNLVNSLKDDNKTLSEKYTKISNIVEEHLNYVIDSLEVYDEVSVTFIGKLAHKLRLQRLKRKTIDIKKIINNKGNTLKGEKNENK